MHGFLGWHMQRWHNLSKFFHPHKNEPNPYPELEILTLCVKGSNSDRFCLGHLPVLLSDFIIELCKVPSRSLSWLVAHPRIVRLFMKGKFDAYVLWPLAKRIQNWIVARSTACKIMVSKNLISFYECTYSEIGKKLIREEFNLSLPEKALKIYCLTSVLCQGLQAVNRFWSNYTQARRKVWKSGGGS